MKSNLQLITIIAVFLSSFLSFSIQPAIGKILLPLFGGGANIWSSVTLFFIVILFLSNVYSHILSRLSPRIQFLIHFILITISFIWNAFLTFEIVPLTAFTPALAIFYTLFLKFGIPLLVLTSTSTVLQNWYQNIGRKSPYHLYAFSNLGSFAALISYPFLIEPAISLNLQLHIWRALFAFELILLTSIILLNKQNTIAKLTVPTLVRSQTIMKWLAISFATNSLLISTTSHLTQNIAPVPLLWLVPLSLFLLSYVIPFSKGRLITRFPLSLITICVAISYMAIQQLDFARPYMLNLIFELLAFASLTLSLHTELYASRPAAPNLTLFYLVIGFGGVIAGIVCSVLAPLYFSDLWEFPLSLAFSFAILSGIYFNRSKQIFPKIISIVFLLGSLYSLWQIHKEIFYPPAEIIAHSRNYYGILNVLERKAGGSYIFRELNSNHIMHGDQVLSADLIDTATTYYTADSGVGLAILNHPRNQENYNLRIGAIGLGVGTISAFCNAGDIYRFYELNPQVVVYAEKYFTYLAHCRERGGTVETVIGDARLSLAQEFAVQSSQQFDIFVVDAFSGDAIPTHLLTQEAFELYLGHLANSGIIAVHITNGYLDFKNLIVALAAQKELYYAFLESSESSWALLSRQPNSLLPTLTNHYPPTDFRVWTDNYSNILDLLKNQSL